MADQTSAEKSLTSRRTTGALGRLRAAPASAQRMHLGQIILELCSVCARISCGKCYLYGQCVPEIDYVQPGCEIYVGSDADVGLSPARCERADSRAIGAAGKSC